jgi:surfeit locus 1 family protein
MRMEVESLTGVSVAPAKVRRRPAWLPGLAALFFLALTLRLGFWQLDRADAKLALQAAHDRAAALPVLDLDATPAPLPYRRARVSGHFDSAFGIFLDNRIREGRAGYHRIVPLVYRGGTLLVNRGWLPAAGDRSVPPAAPASPARVTLEGLLVPASSHYLELSSHDVSGPVWENLDLARYRTWLRHDLPDLVLLQTSPADDGLVRDWPRPDSGASRHLGYAAQWFAMAAAIVGLYLYYGVWKRFYAPR